MLICGYTVAESFDKEDVKDIGVYGSECYADIEDIEYATYEEIDLKIIMGEAERIEKLQHIRYYFDHNIIQNKHCGICEREEIFEYYIKHKGEFLKKLKYIDRFENQEIDEVYRCTNIYQDNIVQKLQSINELKVIVGVATSFENKKIPIANILAAGDYVQSNLKNLQKIWNLDLRKINFRRK